MKKNVVFWVGVKNETYSEKYGGWDWLDISRKTWEYWCKKHDVLFVPFEKPIEKDLIKFRINWQKALFVFDELERRGIDYDQIYLVDGMNMIKWNAPNIFEQTNHKFTAWRDIDNLNWIQKSKEGYKSFFNDYELDLTKYFSSGLIIFNETHREVFNGLKDLYYNNIDTFIDLQDNTVRKGTEQTPLNYWLQINNVDIKTDLSLSWKFTHMHRKDLYHYNWQLNENNTPFFIKYGYVWNFSGFDKSQRTKVMSDVWGRVKHHYNDDFVINKISNKSTKKYTTSQQFKEDLLYYFSDPKYKQMNVLELGSCRGDTTRVLAECFNHVYGYERSPENLIDASKITEDCNNVSLTEADVYSSDFKLPDVPIHVAFIDAGHTPEHLKTDIERITKKYGDIILIFDDYGQPDKALHSVINSCNIGRYIGENAGFITANGIKFITSEGVICNI